jgi:succinate dehydrogenase/fumarate reductase iron-sulfur protein
MSTRPLPVDPAPPAHRITLVVARTAPGSARRSERFELSVDNPRACVLDALLQVRREHDPELGFRYACRVGMCGSCAMVVNGRERLACRTSLAELGTAEVRLEPLRALPVVRDLITDLRPFFEAARRVHAALDPREPGHDRPRTLAPQAEPRATIERLNGCITCGACFAACEWSRAHEGYLGPAALARLLMLALDERDARGRRRLAAAATAAGVLRCHTLGSCTVVCPVDVPLKEAMQRLKALLAAGDVGGSAAG